MRYSQTVRNDYLGKSKVVSASSEGELAMKVQSQLEVWGRQERDKRSAEKARQAEYQTIERMKAQADSQTREAQAMIESFRNLLRNSLQRDPWFDWDSLRDHSAPPVLEDFAPVPRRGFTGKEPSLGDCSPDDHAPKKPFLGVIRARLGVPGPSFWEKLFLGLAARRLTLERQARQVYEQECLAYEQEYRDYVRKQHMDKEQERLRYEQALYKACKTHLLALLKWRIRQLRHYEDYRYLLEQHRQRQLRHNAAVDEAEKAFRDGVPDAVKNYIDRVLSASPYPQGLAVKSETQYDQASATAIVNSWLPHPSHMPQNGEYKYVASRREIQPVPIKPKDIAALYDSAINQIALRTISEVLRAVYSPEHVTAVVFNGWINGVDPKTGKKFTACIISCLANRDDFEKLDLAHVDPKECIRGLKGLVAGPLAQLAPVKPIMHLNREDSRFVQSKEVLASLSSSDNLAEMPWEDFEHLIRELFSRIFSTDGSEVRVTQASRDAGVDAVAFDPDPIRGGKFVIQAKRYNNVVGVSAVRDLYGTMINEGAVKGILVTTSYYGPDSWEFVKDKPITLIDGANLVHLMQEHGHDVRIELRQSASSGQGGQS